MTLTVDNPILNSPYREPTSYWLYDNDGMPRVENGRRRAGYYFRARTRADERQLSFLSDEQFEELGVVNLIRQRVREWRESGYAGATPVSKQLLAHWQQPDRERRLFFCQIEAAETIIWLTEIRGDRKLGIDLPVDMPLDGESGALTRYAIKMATGSGKTVVMAMIMAWSIINKVMNPQDRRFCDAVLIVTPNLTVRERLGGGAGPVLVEVEPEDGDEEEEESEDEVLRTAAPLLVEPERALIPGARGNYWDRFDLVPSTYAPYLGQGRVQIVNWHKLAINDDSGKRQIVQRGREGNAAFANRVLRDLGSKKNLLVINDEAHHAYRPAPYSDENRPDGMSAAEWDEIKATKEEATVWVSGLDRIHAARRINSVIDLSATPFYIQGSGYPEGSPFPWIVSDFGLVDAIECGIVKIPRVPVADDTGQPIPKYFRLWQAINEALPAKDRATARRKPKPEAVVREAEGALQALAGEWQDTFKQWQKDGYLVPPTLIAVCDNTSIAEYLYEKIAIEGAVFPEHLKNEPGLERTIRIDSKLLANAEAETGSGSKAEVAEALRRKVATVGKVGEPGEQVRCVISVGMLTEGWDAQNVTQVFGLRAFESQLLCEQVVGRGLRRISYDFDLDENDVPQNEEYVDIYGIPFEVIPTKKKPTSAPPQLKDSTLVKSLPERERLKIEFPRVEGFVWQVSSQITADIDSVPVLKIEPTQEPTEVISVARVGYQTGGSIVAPGESIVTTREAFYEQNRPQRIEYVIAGRVTEALLAHESFRFSARQILFPQVLAIVRAYLDRRVVYNGMDRRELGLEKYVQFISERLADAIRPADDDGKSTLLPRIERFRPRGSTAEVLFRTTRTCRPTIRSHISHVVLDTATWEASAALKLETSPLVQSYARNDHLDFAIAYTFAGAPHNFFPDFLVRLVNGVMLILEVKGQEQEQDRAKYTAAQRWCEAVSNWGQMGRWVFDYCAGPGSVGELLREYFT